MIQDSAKRAKYLIECSLELDELKESVIRRVNSLYNFHLEKKSDQKHKKLKKLT
jgi:hypothetical protein